MWVAIIVVAIAGGMGVLASGRIPNTGSVFDVPVGGFQLNSDSLGFYTLVAVVASLAALIIDGVAVYLMLRETPVANSSSMCYICLNASRLLSRQVTAHERRKDLRHLREEAWGGVLLRVLHLRSHVLLCPCSPEVRP